MNYSTLKKIYEGLPYIVKAPVSKLLRKKLIRNQIFLETFRMLNEAQTWTEGQVSTEQFRLYKETLIHAYEHTKYYKELFDTVDFNPYEVISYESIKAIPILTKQILQERFSDLIADDAGDGYLVTTGGTSGEPTKVMMSNDAYYVEWAFVYSFWSKYGYDIQASKLATFRGLKLGKKLYEINPMYNEIRMNVFSMGRKNINKYIRVIKKYGADFIYGYPSAIYNFCKLTQDAGISVGNIFKAALLISENLYSFQEKEILEVLKCPIGMFYGHSERAVFAERTENGYLFHPLYGVTEISKKGEPIVTGFINKKTPLIRYLVDDQIKENNGFYSIEGHHDGEVLYGTNGEEISAASINFHDDTFEHVDAYQFLQDNPGECTLLIKAEKEMSQDEINKILKSVRQKIGKSIKCNAKVVDQLILTERGKYKMIIQKVCRNI